MDQMCITVTSEDGRHYGSLATDRDDGDSESCISGGTKAEGSSRGYRDDDDTDYASSHDWATGKLSLTV